MGDLFWNKVFGALLAVGLGFLALSTLSHSMFAAESGEHGGGHGDDAEPSLNEWAESRFAYYTEMADTGAAAGPEEVFDLGLALANADVSVEPSRRCRPRPRRTCRFRVFLRHADTGGRALEL